MNNLTKLERREAIGLIRFLRDDIQHDKVNGEYDECCGLQPSNKGYKALTKILLALEENEQDE